MCRKHVQRLVVCCRKDWRYSFSLEIQLLFLLSQKDSRKSLVQQGIASIRHLSGIYQATSSNVLQRVAAFCSVLQCAAVCCSVLHCAAVCCSALQCDAVRCNKGIHPETSSSWCVAARCSALRHVAALLQRVAVHCKKAASSRNIIIMAPVGPCLLCPRFACPDIANGLG